MQRTAMSPSSVSCLLPVPIANRRLSDISCARLPVKCWPIATRTWDNPPAMFKLHRWIETTPHYSLVQQGVPASLSLAQPATRVQTLAAISTIKALVSETRIFQERAEESRVGKECVRKGRSRVGLVQKKK